MATSSLPVLPQVVQNQKAQILNADGTALKTLWTGDADGSKVTAIIAASTDTSNVDVQIGIERSSVFYILGTIQVLAGAGNSNAVASVNLLDPTKIKGLPLDNDGQPYILLRDATDLLRVKALTTVTATKEIDLNAFGADF